MTVDVPLSQLRSSQRPTPLRGRDDLVVERMEFQGIVHYVIKDPIGLGYHRLRGEQYLVLKLLDGRRTLEQIREELVREYPTHAPTLTEIQQIIAELHQGGLAYGTRSGQGPVRIEQRRKKRRQKLWSYVTNFLSLRLPGWDPDSMLTRMLPYTRWMYHPITAALASVLVLGSWMLLATQFQTFRSRLPAFEQFFGWPNLLLLWITLAGAKIIHEFGHGLTCKYFGGECHEMGIMLLVGSPCLYCDVSDSWMLKNKWSRILIGAGGMIIEVVLSAVAIIVWFMTEPGLLHYLCLNLFFVTAVTTVIFNANPLMRLDGYFMLMDFLEIPNLRQKADRLLREQLAWLCLGDEPKHDPFMPQSGQHWFILYAVSSTIYGWIILFSILAFLYTVLKPHGLQIIGQVLAVSTVCGLIIRSLMGVYRAMVAPRSRPIVRWRLGLTVLFLVAVGIGLGTCPIPLIHWAAFAIEPQGARRVMTQLPGELIELKVQPGDHVVAGQLLATFQNAELEDRLRELTVKRSLQAKAIQLAMTLDSPSDRVLAEEGLHTVQQQIDELSEQIRQLTITAPVAGTVVAPPRQLPPTLAQSKTRLGHWYGTPLDEKNMGCFLQERTHLLTIAPSDAMQATLYLDQADRHEVKPGLSVRLMFDHLPGQVFHGEVSQVAEAHTDTAPQQLSVKHGGQLSTVTDREGNEQLPDAAYQATVLLSEAPGLLKSNLRGNARFVATRRSAFSWFWRFFRRTFHFRM